MVIGVQYGIFYHTFIRKKLKFKDAVVISTGWVLIFKGGL